MVREFLAEFLGIILSSQLSILKFVEREHFAGTFVLVVFGTASIAQSVLSLRTKGNFLTINWGSVGQSLLSDSGMLTMMMFLDGVWV